jgi:hypothetical protein
VRYGAATWVDARGQRTAVRSAYADGSIVLTVPASAVDASAYPAVLDPIVGPEIEMDAPVYSPPVNKQSEPAIAFGGGNYLVVWTDERVQPSVGRIFGTRVSPTGVVLDPTGVAISPATRPDGHGASEPAVAWNGTCWLTAWVDDTQGALFAARVSDQGVVLDTGSTFLASAFTGTTKRVAMASDGAGFLVAWSEHSAGSTVEVVMQRLGSDGAPLDPAPVLVSADGGDPALAYNGTNYLLAYTAGFTQVPQPLHLVARRISAAGAVLDPAEIVLGADTGKSLGPVSVASDGSDWLVAWRATWGDIVGQRVQSDGTPLDGAGLSISISSGQSSLPAAGVSVVRGASDYAVLWFRDGELYGARVSSGGSVVATTGGILTQPGYYDAVAAAWDGANFLAVFDQPLVFGTRLDPMLAKVDPVKLPISVVANDQWNPAAAYDGMNWLVAWRDSRGPIYGTRLSPAGVVLDSAGVVIGDNPSGQYGVQPSVASNGSGWLVVWQVLDTGSTSSTVTAARVSTGGVVLDPAGVTLGVSAFITNVAVASNGTDYLVGWTNHGIWAGRVTALGAALDPSAIPVAVANFNQGTPAISWNGTSYLVAWEVGYAWTGSGIFAARVAPSGTVLDVGASVITVSPSAASPSVASDGDNWLVTWLGGPAGVFARRVTAAGVPLDSATIPAIPGVKGSLLGVAWDGRQPWLTWQAQLGGVADVFAFSDVYATRLSAVGASLDASPIPVAVGPEDKDTPVIAAGPEKHVLIAYGGYDETPLYGSRRVRARILSDPTPNGAACAEDAGCQSGVCADGVCCEGPCLGTCQACSAAKKGAGVDGVCGPIAGATDPDDECAAAAPSTCQQSGLCDGNGACGLWPSGTACVPAACDGATETALSICDGQGACAPVVTTTCAAGYQCVGLTCATSCTDDAACAAGYACDSTLDACVPKPDGGGGSGGAGGSASSSAGAGGAGGAPGTTGSTGGAATTPSLEGGCACATVGVESTEDDGALHGTGLAALALLAYRRRRRRLA